jgi:hypothetical protein
MNKNIEVINENLWAVNQYYVQAGYIKELETLPGQTPETHGISLSDTGVLILNTADPAHDITRKLLLKIMEHSDEQLKFAYNKMQQVQSPDTYEKMYLNVLEWEIKRRCVKAEFLNSQPKPTFKDKIIIYWRKKVRELWHLFRLE